MRAGVWALLAALPGVAGNPIYVQHRRTRTRWAPTLTWALVTLTVVTFIFVLTYLTLTRRGAFDPVAAAKATLVPLIVVQGVLLMGMGTSAVATGIARERDRALLDYHRMTPQPPAAKIVGYLFGLPAREYLLFALTLPFVAYAVWRAGVSPLTVGHFYVVFFSSVWLYHLTGLMAGMVARKAWQSSFVSLGAVAGLYLVLPQFAELGLSFFDFLTVRPTFYGMVAAELETAPAGAAALTQRMSMVRQYEAVPFFGLRVNPTLFSLAVQLFALSAMYHVVSRKWVDAAWHPFSKRFAVGFVGGMALLLAGSLWPLLHDAKANADLIARLFGEGPGVVLGLLVGLFFVVAAVTLLLSVALTTPGRHTQRRGLRRARKLGRDTPPAAWDAATSWPGTAAMLGLVLAGYGVVAWAVRDGVVYDWRPTMGFWLLAPLPLGVAVVLAFQGLLERFGQRAVILGLFVLWVVPVMAGIVMVAASNALWRGAMYLAAFCPAVAGGMCLSFLIDAVGDGPATILIDTPAEDDARRIVLLTTVFYVALALLGQWLRLRGAVRLRREEPAGPDASTPAAARPPDPPPPAAG